MENGTFNEDPNQEILEIDEELYAKLKKLREDGRSKEFIEQQLIIEKFETEDAKIVAGEIDQAYKEVKLKESKKLITQSISILIIGMILFISNMSIFGRLSFGIIAITLALAGLKLNTALNIRNVCLE